MSSQRSFLFHPVARAGIAVLAALTLPRILPAQQQPVTITGLVQSDAGVPLVSAAVTIQTMNITTVTRGDGRYTIVIPSVRVAGQTVTLTVRLVGFSSGSAQLTLSGGAITQNFTLVTNPFQLGTVVVTGQGTQATVEQLGNSRSAVAAAEIQRSNEPNIITALAAKAPNVEVTSSSGQPGVSTYIQLRGLTTLTSSDGQPLIVVDGVPVDNSIEQSVGFAPGMNSAANGGPQQPNRALDINPDDVENVEILKGPSAAAIYGSRAGQGVILITTKHGNAGQTHYSLKSSGSLDNASTIPYLQSTYGMGSEGKTFSCAGIADCAPPNRGASWGGLIPAGTPLFDHAHELFTTGHVYDDALTASGGNDRTQFYASGAYNYNRGMIIGPNDSYGRTSLRFNGAHQVNSDLRMSANIAFAASNGNYVESSNSVSSLLLGEFRTPATYNNQDYLNPASGEPQATRFENAGPNTDFLTRIYDNPFFVAYNQKNVANVNRTFGNYLVDYQALPWLKINENIGADYSNDERLYSEPWTSGNSAGLNNIASNVALGEVTQGFVKLWQIDQNISATAQHTFSPRFDGSLTVGNNINVRQYNTSATTGWALTAPQPYTLTNTSIIQSPNAYTYNLRSASFFGQVQANLFKQVTVTAALRDDGVSTFGPSKQFALFPKGSIAWNIIRQDDNSNSILTSLKLRAAYGESGTQPQAYALAATLRSPTYSDGFTGGVPVSNVNGQGGLATGPIEPNPNLTTERQKEFETGTDIAFLKNRGDISISFYKQNTDGAIFPVSVPSFTGYSVQYENAANFWNQGWEVALNLRPITTRLFAWDVGVNWARNRSEVTSLPSGVQFVDIGGTGGLGGITGAAVPGQQVPVYYGTDFVRCGRGTILNGVNIDQVAGECQGAKRNALYIGPDGYPVVDNSKQYVIGNPNRNWIGSVHTGIHIQKFAITALLDIQNGGDSYNGTKGALNWFGRSYDSYYYRLHTGGIVFGSSYMPGAVAGEGAGKSVQLDQSWFQGQGGVFNGASSYFVEHSGFAKLREITLAYTFDQPWVQARTPFSSIELRVAGRNLQTWTSYSGIDPETSILGSASPVRGIDYFDLPQDRSYVFAITLNR